MNTQCQVGTPDGSSVIIRHSLVQLPNDFKITQISIDAEWVKRPNRYGSSVSYLAKQYTLYNGNYQSVNLVLWNADFPPPSIELCNDRNVTLILCDVDKINIFDVVEMLRLEFSNKLDIYLFYSPVDITACLLSKEEMTTAICDDLISKKRNINGTVRTHEIDLVMKDLYGAFNCGLDKAFETVGIDVTTKNLVKKEEKADMAKPMRERPDDFLRYIVGDTEQLYPLWKKRVNQINQVVEGALGFNPNFKTGDCPRTMGKLVYVVFSKWLASKYPLLMVLVNLLAEVHDSDKQVYKTFKKKVKNKRLELNANGNFYFRYYERNVLKHKCISPDKPDYVFSHSIPGLGRGSIRALGSIDSTAAFNALVQGGRCNNEQPHDFRLKEAYDIDLQGCYGSSLTRFNYPIGKPTVYGTAQDTETITLREFLEANKNELLPNLYQIVVCGKLDFEQDLVYSKLNVTTASIHRDLGKPEGEDWDLGSEIEVEAEHIKGDFALLRKEIVNGIITHEVLETIKQISNNQEMNDWYNLEVKAAAYYKASDLVSVDELCNVLREDEGMLDTCKKTGHKIDTRTTKWTLIPIGDFLGGFIKYRKELKSKKVHKGDEWDLMQNAVKLFINTFYGDLASPYFAMGNVIVANNITASARVGSWMMCKAMGLVEAVTDGGLYSTSRRIKNTTAKRPSFHTLSDAIRLERHRNVETFKLFDFESIYHRLQQGDKSVRQEMDDKALQHILDFWSAYGLQMPFKVEHKYENTCRRAVYWGKSDYLLVEPAIIEEENRDLNAEEMVGEIPHQIKVRGAREYDHIKKLWLYYIAGIHPKPPTKYVYQQLVGINQYKEAVKHKSDWTEYLMPGEELTRTNYLKLNLQHFPTIDAKHFERKNRSHAQNSRNYLKRVEEKEENLEFGFLSSLDEAFEPTKLKTMLDKEQKRIESLSKEDK